MSDTKIKKKRRARGSGSVYKMGRVWWISYFGPDGKRHAESAESEIKGNAERLLLRRVGSRELNLPVIPKAERLTFDDAAKAVITRYENDNKPSLVVLKRRIVKHLTPFFTGRRMAGITTDDIGAYVAHRRQQGITGWKGKRKGQRISDVSNSEINRELGILKLIFSRALKGKRIGSMPYVEMLNEPPARQGFFERGQITAVLKHLPPELAAPVEFAAETGWRIASEVLPLQWKQVDLKEGTVELEGGTTKNGEGRLIYFTQALRRILEAQDVERARLKKAGHICPLVFFREVADKRGGEKKPRAIGSLRRAWALACRAAGVPGKKLHDLRRTAVRNLDNKGISRDVAMKMVGHKTEEIYRRYRIVDKTDIRSAARQQDDVTAAAAPTGS